MIVVWMKVYLIYFLIYSFYSVWMKGYLICFLIYSFYSITLFSAQLLGTLQIWFCYKITSNQFCLPKSKISFSDAHCDLNFFPDLTVLRSHYKILKKERQAVARRFCKKGVPKSFAKLTGTQLCWSLFSIKVAGLRPATLLKKTLTYVLSCESCETFKNTFFHRKSPRDCFY